MSQRGWPWTAAPSVDLPEAPAPGVVWPRITVVTPSFNQGEFLEATLRSVLLQGYPNLEYLVMDGGSTDESVALIRQYEPWLKNWVSAPDGGQSQAINQGMRQASGQVLAWLNSDDTYEPGALIRIGHAFAENPAAALIFGQAYQISRTGRRIGQASARAYDRRWLLEQGNSIPQPSAFFSRHAWQAVGPLNEALHFAMDYDLWFRLGDHGPVQFLPEFLSDQRIYPQAKTSAGDHRHYREVRQVIERYGGSGLPAGFADWLLETHLPKAWEGYRSGDIATGQAELSYVLENVPALRAEDRLAQEIARYAWAMSLGLAGQDAAGLAFARLVCEHLPAAVARPARLRRRVLASLHKASAQRLFARGERAQVWRHVGQTLVHAPGYARDRGLWSMSARALLRPVPDSHQPLNLEPVRQRLLAWLETLRGERPVGQYSLIAGAGVASLEASALAAQIRAIWGTPALPQAETALWTQFILSQPAAPAISPLPSPGASSELDEWDKTLLTISGLRSLGVTYAARLPLVEPFLKLERTTAWLEQLNWAQPCAASQQIKRLAVGLAQEHARTGAAVYWQTLEGIGSWLAARVKSETGLWTFDQALTPLEALSNASNLSPLFALLDQPLPGGEPLIASILDLQRFSGLFGAGQPDEAWADLTVVDTLARVNFSGHARAAEVQLAMAFALRAILRRQLPDGGFAAGPQPAASELRPTWLRSLTLAIIAARWPQLVTSPLASRFPSLPEVGAGHSASALAAPLSANK